MSNNEYLGKTYRDKISGFEGVVTSYCIYQKDRASTYEIKFLEDTSLYNLELIETFKGLLQKLVYSFQNEEFKHEHDGKRSQIFWDE